MRINECIAAAEKVLAAGAEVDVANAWLAIAREHRAEENRLIRKAARKLSKYIDKNAGDLDVSEMQNLLFGIVYVAEGGE